MDHLTDDTLHKEIFIQCKPKTLFSFFTDPDKMVRWIGRHILLEPKIGGKYRVDINGQDIAIGEYRELVPFEKVVLTWGWEDSTIMPPGSSKVEFLLTPKDNGTLLELNHYDLPSEKYKSNNEGWTHYMQRLHLLAEGHDPGVDPWSIQK
jgi:uncharacterized protein YndB with AHSA1/START domain